MFKHYQAAAATSALLGVALIQPANAISVTNIQETEPAPPNSIENNQYTNPDELFYFQEKSNYTLGSDVDVDIESPGTYNSPESDAGSIAQGTPVDSFYFSYDVATDQTIRIGSESEPAASVTFDREVLGIVAETSDLNASDAEVGASGTTYATVGSRGVLEGGGDSLTLSEDGLTLTFNSVNANDGSLDQTRVITEAVPFELETGVGTAFVGLWFSWQLCKRRRYSKVETK